MSDSTRGFPYSPRKDAPAKLPGTPPGGGAPRRDAAETREATPPLPVPEFPSSEYIKVPDSGMLSSDGIQLPKGRDERMAVSFPGLLKVLVPEQSFLPITLAVRVANLSAGGAMVEIHDRAKVESIHLAGRFFELKVAHQELPMLRGTVAWSDTARANPMLGLQLFDRNPILEQIVLNTETAVKYQKEGPPPLPAPVIDPFEPIAVQPRLILTGTAPESTEIIVKNDVVKYSAKVVKDRFSIEVELSPGENQFALRSIAGQRRSRNVPIRIDFSATPPKKFQFEAEMNTDQYGVQNISLKFRGSVRQAERVLYRFSQVMAFSELIELNATLQSHGTFDKRLFDSLKAEGALLASDNEKNEIATRLLEELL